MGTRSPTSAPVSTSARTPSSTKTRLPSVRPISSGFSRWTVGSAPSSASSISWAVARPSGSMRNCVYVALVAPGVAVFLAVVDQQQRPRSGQTVHQAVQERLRLAVDPVQILEHQHQRLHLGFAQGQPFARIQGALPLLHRIEGRPSLVVDGNIQRREQRHEVRLERLVQGQSSVWRRQPVKTRDRCVSACRRVGSVPVTDDVARLSEATGREIGLTPSGCHI